MYDSTSYKDKAKRPKVKAKQNVALNSLILALKKFLLIFSEIVHCDK